MVKHVVYKYLDMRRRQTTSRHIMSILQHMIYSLMPFPHPYDSALVAAEGISLELAAIAAFSAFFFFFLAALRLADCANST